MHFSQTNEQGGTRYSKLAVVAAVHVVLGALFVHTINTRGISMPKVPDELVVMFTPEAPKPPPPPIQPPKPMPKIAPPQVIAPPVEVKVQQTPPPDSIVAQVSTDVAPQPPTAAVAADPGPVTPAQSKNMGVMRSVALADASGCAMPDYPARAARNNESGTVTLALLVGTNGHVTDSRIKTSSGSRDLDKAAVAALSTCTFKPAMNGGVAEPGWAQIAYVWTLE